MTRFVLAFVFMVTVSVGLNIIGWSFVKPPAINPPRIERNFQAPSVFIELFSDKASELFAPLLLSICTVGGILCNVLYKYSCGRQNKLLIKNFAPLLVSPIVLYSTYYIAKDHPDGFVASLIAFQNGFFWQAILEKKGSVAKESASE